MTILDQIIADKRVEVERRKLSTSLTELQSTDLYQRECISLKKSFRKQAGIIAEFKRKSPSKGTIREQAVAKDIVSSYQSAGASACSILTDEKYFGGTMEDVLESRPFLNIPILRKEFIIDPFQIYEAKSIGADLILLIAECLDKNQIRDYSSIAHDLGMEVLMELHFDDELNKWNEGIDLLGVNNRNLQTFDTGIERSLELVPRLPVESIWVSESGLKGADEIITLMDHGYRGFLIGETFMKSPDPGLACTYFIETIHQHSIA